MIPLPDQIACVQREIRLRQAVYPGLVYRLKMTEAQAQLELTRMEAVLLTLQQVQEQETEQQQLALFGASRTHPEKGTPHVN